jgi:hypothetical protein
MTQHNNIQNNYTLSIMTFSITLKIEKRSIMTLSITLKIITLSIMTFSITQKIEKLSIMTLSITLKIETLSVMALHYGDTVMLSVVIQSVIYAECRE